MNDPPPEMNRDFAASNPLPGVMRAEDVFLNDGEGSDEVAAGPVEKGKQGPPRDLVPENVGTQFGASRGLSTGGEAAPAPVATHPTGSVVLGPGFWESIAWMIGMHAVQFGAVVLACVLMFARFVLTEGMDLSRSGPAELINQIMPFFRGNLVCILGVAQVATILYGLLAIGWRIRPHGLRRLGWQFPWLGHWLLVVLLMPPLCLLCSVLQNVMFQWMPGSETSMKELMDSLGQAPLSLLVLVIGLGPALAEELVFRGLVGRGLVARRGLVQGMLITSVLFGVMHVNPAQAIGVIPLGFAMHFVYFTTRSFWSPVTLHLFNNSLSAILLKQAADMPVNKLLETNSELPVALLVVALAMVTAIGVLLWQTRVQYILPDGSHWNPGYTSTATPPPEVHAVAMRQSARLLLLAGGLLSTLGFAAALWQSAR